MVEQNVNANLTPAPSVYAHMRVVVAMKVAAVVKGLLLTV